MIKTIKIIGITFIISAFLSGCGNPDMYYKGKLMPQNDVEELIADELELENQNMDLEVNIYEEVGED